MSVNFNTMSYANPYRQTALKPKTEFKSNYMQQNTNQQNVGFGSARSFLKYGVIPAIGLGMITAPISACVMKTFSKPEQVQVLPAQNEIAQSAKNAMAAVEKEAGGKFVMPAKNATVKLINACVEAGKTAVPYIDDAGKIAVKCIK
ncbi:MAG: hypothetical protein A2104_05045 [Candidatus Melainabacteria bacterium GWF2_32_7]|nr:MAG: hypothetical protein A2104_05045 [Candidatus Melainabacteria bacterium GWF2_32_7]